jgi:invasion protein IalB
MSLGLRLLTLGMIASGSVASAFAAPADSASTAAPTLHSSEWRIECDNNGKTLDCQIGNQIVQQNGSPIASISIHPLVAAGKTIALVQLPFGIAFNAPVQLSVDGKPPTTLTLNTCLVQGCIASGLLADAFLSEAAAGTKLTLSFGMANARTITMGLPLNGFGLAYHFVTRK